MLTGAPNTALIKASDNVNGFSNTATYWRSTSNAAPPPYNGTIPPKDCTLPPKVVGYYLGSAASRDCLPWAPDVTDSSMYTHIIYGYATVQGDGIVTMTDAQKAQLQTMMSMKDLERNLTIMIGVGGWGFGSDTTAFIFMSQFDAAITNFASTIAQIVNDVEADGVDIEWPRCQGSICQVPSQLATIVSRTKSALGGSFIVSVQLPLDFWNLSGLSDAMPVIGAAVDWVSILTSYTGSRLANGEDSNSMDMIEPTFQLAQIQSNAIPSSIYLYGIPFYSRPSGTSTLQSSCIPSGGLGQGTHPYYAANAVINGYVFDTDPFTEYGMDIDTLQHSTLIAESTWSVAKRAKRSADLCFGGVAVYSIDQDNMDSDLTNGIYSTGGFLPTADVIRSAISPGKAIDSNGYVTPAFHLLIMFPEDSCCTGAGCNGGGGPGGHPGIVPNVTTSNTATSNSASNETVVARSNVTTAHSNSTDIGARALTKRGGDLLDPPADCHTTWDGLYLIDVDNRRVQASGSKEPPKSHRRHNLAVEPLVCARSESHAVAPWLLRNLSNMFQNPKDIINGYIASTAQSVNDFAIMAVEPTTETLLLMSMLQATLTAVALGNAPLRILKLTSFKRNKMKRRKVGSIVYVLDDHRVLIALNSAKVEAEARSSVLELVETIGVSFRATQNAISLTVSPNIQMILLSFIPDVGEITDLAMGGFDVAGAISKIADIASLAKTLKTESSFFKLIRTLRTDADVEKAAGEVENAMSASSLLTRGKFGKVVEQTQNQLVSCFDSDLGGFIMDGIDLGSSLAPPPLTRRGLDSDKVHWLFPRKPSDCIFQTLHFDGPSANLVRGRLRLANLGQPQPTSDQVSFSSLTNRFQASEDIKFSSKKYRALCEAANLEMDFPNAWDFPTEAEKVTYKDCLTKAPDPGYCRYDHLFEPNEVKINALKGLSPSEKADFCKSCVFATSREQVTKILNAAKNFCGLWGDNTDESKLNPNTVKSSLLTSFNKDSAIATAFKKWDKKGRDLMYTIANDHIQRFASEREAVADDLDTLFHQWHTSLASSGTASQQAALAKICAKSPENTARSKNTIDKLKQKEDDTKQQSDTDDLVDATDDSQQKRAKPKVTHNGSGDGSSGSGSGVFCGTQDGRASKRRKF
ncbi:hypothetical protein B0H13DRAFT_2672532 [Mycena leptocephala]|nr:hypothetical protein B0H13DRAFT_2672532 [Mycena leptocephala]